MKIKTYIIKHKLNCYIKNINNRGLHLLKYPTAIDLKDIDDSDIFIEDIFFSEKTELHNKTTFNSFLDFHYLFPFLIKNKEYFVNGLKYIVNKEFSTSYKKNSFYQRLIVYISSTYVDNKKDILLGLIQSGELHEYKKVQCLLAINLL
jgi:hypothetical protein